MENLYFSENDKPEYILGKANSITLPTGKESGPIRGWLEEKMGWEYPKFIGRCLHLNSKQ